MEGAIDARCNTLFDLILVETVLEGVKGGGNLVPGLVRFANDAVVLGVLVSTFSGYIGLCRRHNNNFCIVVNIAGGLESNSSG